MPLHFVDTDSSNPPNLVSLGYQCRSFESSYNILRPIRAKTLCSYIVNDIRCGGGHTVIIGDHRQDIGIDSSVSTDLSMIQSSNSVQVN